MHLLQNELGTLPPGDSVWTILPNDAGGYTVHRVTKTIGKQTNWTWEKRFWRATPKPNDTYHTAREAWTEVVRRLELLLSNARQQCDTATNNTPSPPA